MKKKISLKMVLLLSSIFILIAFMMTNTWVTNGFIKRNLETDSYKILYNYTTLSKQALEDRIEDVTNTFHAVENSPAFMKFYTELAKGDWNNRMQSYIQLNDFLLNTYYANYEALDSIFITFQNRDVTIYQRHELFQNIDYNFDDWYEKYPPLPNQSYQWAITYSNPVFTSQDIHETITLFKYIGDDHASPQGIIMFNINKSYFDEILKDNSLYEEGYFFLLNTDQIISFNDSSKSFDIMDEAYKHIYSKDEGGFLIEGQRNLSIVYTLLEPMEWKLCYIAPEELLTRDYHQIVRINYSILILLLLPAIFLLFLIIRRTTAHIYRLIKQAEAMGSGNFNMQPCNSYFHEIHVLDQRFILMGKRIHQLLTTIELEKEKEKQLELAILQAQINPHFLYNTLYSIKQLCQIEGSTKSAHLLQSLSDFYRISLSKGVEFISLENEIQHIKNYMAIEQSKVTHDFEIKYEIDPFLLEETIVKLTLQPLVENAIQHGLKNTRRKGFILIQCIPIETCIEITIQDNGCGIDVQTLDAIRHQCATDLNRDEIPTHYGLPNVHQRLRLYYGAQYGIVNIDSTLDKGTSVTLHIPYGRQEDEDEL